mmetsp:Transcript_13732/g.29895  ORF Transcript_13732/g.29895 Transcript_13732/m.29895 type:complete len:86 (+) Transcript_13732:271-528(+)
MDAAPTFRKAVRFFQVVSGLMHSTTINMAAFLASVGPPPSMEGFTSESTIGSNMSRNKTAYPTVAKKQQTQTKAMENSRALGPNA